MFDKEIYKLFQVSDALVNSHKYSQIVVKDPDSENNETKDELWYLNYDNSYYQAIRVTYHSAKNFTYEKERIEKYLSVFIKDKDIEHISFLDIHISSDKFDEELEDYDYVNIEDGYYDGVYLKDKYPELYTCIREVNDVKREMKRILSRAISSKNNNRFLKNYPHFFTYLIIGICIFMYIVSFFLGRKYDDASVFIALGADYKTFTLGLGQFYRLISCAFLHGSFMHLLFNMISLYSIGTYIERTYGHIRFLSILFYSIVIGALTSEILTDNSLVLGISGGIYGLFIFYVMDIIKNKIINVNSLLLTLLINLGINFMGSTSWQSHIGGMIGGLMMYLLLTSKQKLGPGILSAVLLGCLFGKFCMIDHIDSAYLGTDNKVLQIYRDLGLNKYANKLAGKLIEAYVKYFG